MDENYLKNLYIPSASSHKGQNGRLLIIGGSHLFHSASLWSLEVASRIVDLVHYSSILENNKIVQKLKEEFRNGIVVPRVEIENYIEEDDCILIGPGMVRTESRIKNYELRIKNSQDIEKIEDEGILTYYLTKYLLQKYPNKKWVIDAGALQMMEVDWIPQNAIITPHKREFELLISKMTSSHPEFISGSYKIPKQVRNDIKRQVKFFAEKYHCVVLLKGEQDIVTSKDKMEIIERGNAGMTKGGTGDVLAGLVAAFYCKNDAFISSVSASIINKTAGDDLYEKKGYWFNASDLADQIPETMKRLLLM